MANTHSVNFVRASNQYALRTTSARPSDTFTVEFWLRFTSFPGIGEYHRILRKTGTSSIPVIDINARGLNSTTLRFAAAVHRTDGSPSRNQWDVARTTVDGGEWHHYAFTFNLPEPTATEKFLYLDGTPVAYGDVDSGTSVTISNWASGSGNLTLSDASLTLGGDLDDVRVWNTIRSPSQIAYNWHRGLDAGDADFGDLWAYWRLDNDWLDASGTGLHLTPSNGPTFGSPAFVDAGAPITRRTPHGMVPRPQSDKDAVNREFARIEIQEAGAALYNPNNWNIINFRTGFSLVEEVGTPGYIHIDNTGGGLPGAHATTHEDGGTDELTLQNLGSGAAPINKILESDGAGGWNLIDTPTGGGGGATAATGIYERQASAAIPEGDATLPEITTGIAAYTGSAIALAIKVEDAVTAGTITVTLKVAGSATLVAQLTTGVPNKVVTLASIGAHPIAFEDEITIAIQTAGGYTNAAGATTGMTIDFTMINGEVGGAAQVSSTTVFTCPAGVNVLDAVYLSSADSVDLADADDPAKQPLIGLVRTKPTTTTCEVVYYGEVSGFTGLTVGASYFLSQTPGALTATAPTDPGSIVQKVGFARNANTLVVFMDRDYIEN